MYQHDNAGEYVLRASIVTSHSRWRRWTTQPIGGAAHAYLPSETDAISPHLPLVLGGPSGATRLALITDHGVVQDCRRPVRLPQSAGIAAAGGVGLVDDEKYPDSLLLFLSAPSRAAARMRHSKSKYYTRTVRLMEVYVESAPGRHL